MIEIIESAFEDEYKIYLISKGISDDEIKYIVQKKTNKLIKLDLRKLYI